MMLNDDDGLAEREESLGSADGSVVIGDDDDDDDDETGSMLDLSLESSLSSSSSSNDNNSEDNEDDHSGGVVHVVVDAEEMEGLEFEDDEDWSSEEEEEEEEEEDHGVAVQHHHEHEHENVFCDECGCNPIVGVRYKSTMQNNYDICRECLEENHDNDTAGFFALARPVPDEAAVNRQVMVGTRTRKSLTFYSLQALIHNRFVQDPHSEIDDITLELSVGTTTSSTTLTDAQADQATRLIAQHTRIKEMEIQVHASTTRRRRRRRNTNNSMMPSTLITKAMVAVARGLAQNKSVQSVAWTILYGRNSNCFCLEDDAYQALHDLVTQSTSIRYLFVFTECDDMFGTPEAAAMMTATILQSNRKLENCLFDGLLTTSVDTIRLQNNHCNHNNDHLFHVSNDNKKKAWKAMQENPKIRRIKATFETNDYMLELLRLDKKHEWTKRWLQLCENDETRCWDILVEAAATGAATNSNNPHGSSSAGAGGACVMMDPVFVIYHLLRSRPQVIRRCGGSV